MINYVISFIVKITVQGCGSRDGNNSPHCTKEFSFAEYDSTKGEECYCNTELCNSAKFVQPGVLMFLLLFLTNCLR